MSMSTFGDLGLTFSISIECHHAISCNTVRLVASYRKIQKVILAYRCQLKGDSLF